MSEEKEVNENEKNEKMEEFEREFKNVTITPLPYYMTELMSFPKEIEEIIRKTAFEHNCTCNMVIEHYLQDLLSDKLDISEITADKIESLREEKPYILVMKDGKPFARFSFFGKELGMKKDDED